MSQRIERGAARAEDAHETPTQSHVSPSMLVYEDDPALMRSGVGATVWGLLMRDA